MHTARPGAGLPLRAHTLQNPADSSKNFELFLPHDFARAELPANTEGESTDVVLTTKGGSTPRKIAVLTRALDIAFRFNRATAGGYPRRGVRACDVFALAYLTGDLHLDTAFWREGGFKTRSHSALTPIDSIDLDRYAIPGQVVRLYVFGPDGELADHHYQVCASKQGDAPQIYISKPGPSTVVGAHTMQSALNFYPATHVGVVDEIRLIPFSADPREPSLNQH
jgi:hypothetical protein